MNMFNMDYWLLMFMRFVALVCLCFPLANATKKQNTESGGGFLVVAGGYEYINKASRTVFLFNTYTQEWSRMADLPTENHHSQLFYAYGKLFNVGGFPKKEYFMIYNSTVQAWTALSNMNFSASFGACGAILAGSLYLIGGSSQKGDGTQVMNNFSFPNWLPGAKLQKKRYHCGAATLGDHVYTCGSGFHDYTCEKYDPVSKSWSFIASMNDYHVGKTLVSLNGHLYAVAGNYLGTAERYDPATNRWSYIKPATKRSSPYSQVTTSGRLIYLVRSRVGENGRYEISTLEVYVPELNGWFLLPSLPEAREHSAIAYLPQLPT